MGDSLWHDAKFAVRNLMRAPAFSAIAIGTLTAGMTGATLIFTVINAVLLRPVPVREPASMIAVSSVGEMAFLQQEPLTCGDFLDLGRDTPSLERVVAHRRTPTVIGAGERARVALGEQVSLAYFDTLGVSTPVGRPFTTADDPEGVVVLSETAWRREFGADATIVGQPIVLGGRSRTVVGVAPKGFTGLFRGIAPEFWIPLDEHARGLVADRTNPQWWVHARLAPGATPERVRAEVAALAATLAERYPSTNAGRAFRVEPLLDASAHPAVPRSLLRGGAIGVLSVAMLVLVVACLNVANLALARAMTRQRDTAVLAALGATRWRIARALISEATILALGAATLAVVLVAWLGQWLSAVSLPLLVSLDFGLSIDWRVLAFAFGVACATAVLFSVGPAAVVTRRPVATVLSSSSRAAVGTSGRWRALLLTAQSAMAALLLAVGGLALRSYANTSHVEPGFLTDRVLVVSASPELAGRDQARGRLYFSSAASAARALPGVAAAGWLHPLPLSLNVRITRLQLGHQVGMAARDLPFVDAAVAGAGVFDALGVPVVEGREFNDGDRLESPRVAVVNEAFAGRFFADQTPLGQRVWVGFPDVAPVEIVGVVRDFKSRTLGDTVRPMIFTSVLQDPMGWGTSTLVVRQAMAGAASLDSVLQTLTTTDRAVPTFDAQPLTRRMSGVLLVPRYAAVLFGTVGALGLALVAVGLFGTVSFWVATRTREVGLRLALGGTRASIIWLVVAQSAMPVIAGLAIGIGGAVLSGRALAVLLYGVSAQDPLTALATTSALVGTAVVASAVPAWRASRLDPMAALRAE